MPLEKRIKEELSNTNKVEEDLCEAYELFYTIKILPVIKEKFLSHLVSTVEDLIFQKIKEMEPKARRYRITLWKNDPVNGKATMRVWKNGAIISYNNQNDYHDLRVFVAHELAHLLCLYKLLDGGFSENNANLFAFFAINGKDTFYKEKAPTLIYKHGELEIISRIQAACPITMKNQTHCSLGVY